MEEDGGLQVRKNKFIGNVCQPLHFMAAHTQVSSFYFKQAFT